MDSAVLNRLRNISVEELGLDETELMELKFSGIENIADIVQNYLEHALKGVNPMMKIEELELSNRIVDILKNWLGVKTVGDLYRSSRREILLQPGIGDGSLHEIELALCRAGLPPIER